MDTGAARSLGSSFSSWFQFMDACANPNRHTDPSMSVRRRELRKIYAARVSDRQRVMLALEFKLFALRHPKLRTRLARTHRRIRESLKIETVSRLIPE